MRLLTLSVHMRRFGVSRIPDIRGGERRRWRRRYAKFLVQISAPAIVAVSDEAHFTPTAARLSGASSAHQRAVEPGQSARLCRCQPVENCNSGKIPDLQARNCDRRAKSDVPRRVGAHNPGTYHAEQRA